MAVGDIVKFGTIKINGSKRSQEIIECTDDTLFTFVDADTEDSKWSWIEANISGGKAYIAKGGGLHHISPKSAKACCKQVTLDGVPYKISLISQNDWISLSAGVYGKFVLSDKRIHSIFTSDEITNNLNAVECKLIDIDTYQHNKPEKGASWSLLYGGENLYYWPILTLINQPPTINGTDKNLGNKTTSFSIDYTVSDEDSGQELTVKEKLNGTVIRTLQNPIQGSTLTFTITDELFASLSMNTTNTIEIEVTDGSATAYRRYTFIKTNSAPIINYAGQSDLGQLTSKPTIRYSVSDNEGDTITVTEKLNGEVIRQFTATSNTNYTITLTDEFWLTCGKNTNTIEISASDVNGGTSYKHITFTRQVNKVQITTKNPIETDAAATKIMVSPDWDKTGCTGKVEVCNNGFDESPTWEDMTTMAALNRPYVFTNKTKTAAKWGIKIRLTLTKNQGYTGEVAIYGFGGAYE